MSSIKNLIKKEINRQKKVINLIPSENYASKDVLAALGSPLTNKYSEGYPGKRYYPGNKIYDQIETEVQNLARIVFKISKSWDVNVQPYSGSPANAAVYMALLKPGDTIMGTKLSHGGHLTHGHKVSFSGIFYNSIQYGVNLKTGFIDYNEVERLAKKNKPKLIICGATAYSRKIDFKKFSEIAKSVSAYLMADISHIAGLISVGLHSSPFPCVDIVTTTTHKTLRGPRGAIIFSRTKEIGDKIDKAVFPGLQGGPHNNVIAAMGVALEEALRPDFKKYQRQVVRNAKVLANELRKYKFNLVSGGTDNHMILVDLKNKNITGIEAEKKLEKSGIMANRNTIPGDISPFRPFGIRMGTPAVTTQGMKEKDMIKIAKKINSILK